MELSKVTITEHVGDEGTPYRVIKGVASVDAAPYRKYERRVHLSYLLTDTEGVTVSAEVEDDDVYGVAIRAMDRGKVIQVTIEEWPDHSVFLTDASTPGY